MNAVGSTGRRNTIQYDSRLAMIAEVASILAYAKSSTKTLSKSRTISRSALQESVKPNHTNHGNCQPEISGPHNAHAASSGPPVPANQTKGISTR
jgi:hypothetical protein